MVNYIVLFCFYRCPSQNMEEFETFVKNFELNLEFISNKNPYLTVVIGDFRTTASESKGLITWRFSSRVEISTRYTELKKIAII